LRLLWQNSLTIFRALIPDGFTRTLYDVHVGGIKGTYGFAKSLLGTVVDGAMLLQKLSSPFGWCDPDLQHKVSRGLGLGLTLVKADLVWQYGTLEQKKELLGQVQVVAESVYQAASKSIKQQWAEAGQTGKKAELVSQWGTRLALEVGSLLVGAGEAKGAVTVVKEMKAVEVIEDAARVEKNCS
jgi:hypothetical protein